MEEAKPRSELKLPSSVPYSHPTGFNSACFSGHPSLLTVLCQSQWETNKKQNKEIKATVFFLSTSFQSKEEKWTCLEVSDEWWSWVLPSAPSFAFLWIRMWLTWAREKEHFQCLYTRYQSDLGESQFIGSLIISPDIVPCLSRIDSISLYWMALYAKHIYGYHFI